MFVLLFKKTTLGLAHSSPLTGKLFYVAIAVSLLDICIVTISAAFSTYGSFLYVFCEGCQSLCLLGTCGG